MRRLILPLLSLGVLQAADLITTYHALSLGGREANPLGEAVLSHGYAPLVGMKLVLYGLAVCAAVCLQRRGLTGRALGVTVCLVLFYSAVVLSNTYQLAVNTPQPITQECRC